MKSCKIIPLITGLVGIAIMSMLQGCGPSTSLPPVREITAVIDVGQLNGSRSVRVYFTPSDGMSSSDALICDGVKMPYEPRGIHLLPGWQGHLPTPPSTGISRCIFNHAGKQWTLNIPAPTLIILTPTAGQMVRRETLLVRYQLTADYPYLAFVLITSNVSNWHLNVSVPNGSGVFNITQAQLASAPAGQAVLQVSQTYQYSGKTQDASFGQDTSFGYIKYNGGFTSQVPINFSP